MKPYGENREDCKMDQKRRYANCAPRAGDLREERAAKRKARAAGKAEIRDVVADMTVEDVPGDGVMRCSPDCPLCFYERDSNDPPRAEDVRLRCAACGDETEATTGCYSPKCSRCGGEREQQTESEEKSG